MADNNEETQYISSITLPDSETYLIKDSELTQKIEQVIGNGKLLHKLTFGAGGAYVFDGSADVTVPVYTGVMI